MNFTDLEELINFVTDELEEQINVACSEQSAEAFAVLGSEIETLVELSKSPEESKLLGIAIAHEVVDRRANPYFPPGPSSTDNPDVDTDMEVPPDATVAVSQEKMDQAAQTAHVLDVAWGRKTE